MSEALAQGDMGIAVACLAPAGVSTAISLWGDADQQATYLPEFVGENPPAAALAMLEPRALFDPFAAADEGPRGGRRLRARRRQVARPARRRRRAVRGRRASSTAEGPALFIVESKADGISVEPEPAMGVRAAPPARWSSRT